MSTTTLSELLIDLGFVTADEMREAFGEHNLSGHRMGEALIDLGYITRSQLRRALEGAAASGQHVIYDKPKLGEVLVGLTLVDESRLGAVLELQQSTSRQLGELLVEMGDCTSEQIDHALDVQQRMMATVETPALDVAAVAKVRVMVVDDSPLASAIVAEGLDFLGYAVSVFQDPLRALEHLHEVAPDIIVSDMNMPGIEGSELCRRVKEMTNGRLPVVILTANEKEIASASLRAGADDYVRKGTSMEELSARLDAILRRTSATAKIRKMFARYTSDAVVDEVLRAGDVVLSGEKREVTVLFADIRNFTRIAESLEAERVMRALNDVLGRLADAVLACGGTLDKYLGDGLMAVFGAPVKHDDDARRALHAARTMIASITERNASAAIPLEIGVAINSGTVVVGSIGSERRTEYTCIGDVVNVASRLCGLAGPGEILLGPGTIERLPDRDDQPDRYVALEPVRLKGKAQPVALYRVVG